MAAATTLVTFLFDCPSAARTVELLGSWDNFSTPYHLKPDSRRGHRTWTGCFSFADIICDGDLSNLGEKRSGSLLMGGTYWYYYKVNDDEEHHNPSQPSTTFCPLLPGQRLNIMEVPTEASSRGNSINSDGFTRNPQDRYLNPVPPVPPKLSSSPRLGDYCQETYTPPTYRFDPPRSATYPSQSRPRSPRFERCARSANTSPRFAPNAVLPDLKNLKEKFASARSAGGSRGLSPNRRPRDLEIGAPTLISTTAEDLNLIPLNLLQVPPTSASSSSSMPSPVELRRREFDPLRSNPVHIRRDLSLDIPRTATGKDILLPQRPQSEASPTSPVGLKIVSGRTRANSADTRRTRVYVYSNEPWLSSPIVPQSPVAENKLMPSWQNSSAVLELPGSSVVDLPTSNLRRGSLDKELPALPRYLVPAPLSVCKSTTGSPVLPGIKDEEEQPREESRMEQAQANSSESKRSHFSTWSSDSSFSVPQSDDEAVNSPTFSSLTSDSSDVGSSESDYQISRSERGEDESNDACSPLPDLPVLRLPIPSFGPDLFNFDIQDGETSPRRSLQNRRTACFGISGFQGYTLPSDESESQSTITKVSSITEPTIANRSSTVSQLETLMSDFGYLGESVL
ncbi:hypothetical protein B0J11DRAFT_504879 [Dendryphion nanum]|uniref:Uncharacterized protein n=1 Tax=Dendryphion nanum TaxID=256645 RepID=A0A9P9IRC7_9PLEO|nr:hypothetical protein B0J11DRAFT_504879 [Dendryphion nanum]